MSPSGQVQEKETNTMANASTTGFGLRACNDAEILKRLQDNLSTKSNQTRCWYLQK